MELTEIQESLNKALPFEASRILARKRESGTNSSMDVTMVKNLNAFLEEKIKSGFLTSAAALRSLCDELVAAQMLAKVQDFADPDLEKTKWKPKRSQDEMRGNAQ